LVIKTLHIITGLNIGGAETMLLRLIKHNPESLNCSVVVSLTGTGKIGTILEKMGITVIYLNMHNWFSIFNAVLNLKKIIKVEKPSLVHCWMYHANIIGGIAAFLAQNKNIVWSIRRSSLQLKESLSTFIIMKIGAMFSGIIPKIIICVAESGLHNHERYGYKRNKMMVIPNGFEIEKFRQDSNIRKRIRKDFDIDDDKIVIGCVGRFHQSKGYDNLIKSADKVIRRFKNVRYMLVGRDLSPQNAILMERINQIGYADHFLLIGETNHVADYMSAMDIFCLPSNTEGFPNALGEAMTSELPCVACDVGDVRKITGDLAILVESDSEKLSKGLCDMLSMDRGERQKIGLMGRKKIEKEYPIKKICQNYYKLYASICFKGEI
tara:strand:- start:14502 stop:15641 length:1140 start_codon:yes stop_codon:yes gene_type:complete